MTAFLALAAALICLALGFLLVPLLRRPRPISPLSKSATDKLAGLYRQQLAEVDADFSAGLLDEKHRSEAKQELERRMLGEWYDAAPAKVTSSGRSSGLALAMVSLIPLATAVLYWQLGSPGALTTPAHAMPAAHPGGHDTSTGQIAVMVDNLARKLDEQPQNPQGWAMLARSYDVLGRHSDAAVAVNGFSWARFCIVWAAFIMVFPQDAEKLTPVLREVMAGGVRVFAFSSDIPEDACSCAVSTDERTLGRIAGHIRTEKVLSFLFEQAVKVAPEPTPVALPEAPAEAEA